MATTLIVDYTQDKDPGHPGTITFNGNSMPASGGPDNASGRLDNIGDTVFAAGFELNSFDVEVECTRTSHKTMRVRVVIIGPSIDQGDGTYELQPSIEKVIEDVPLDFYK